MSDAEKGEEKKLIIDEDWKTQVEREREQVRSPDAPADSPAEASADAPSESDQPQDYQLPPASFELLISNLATQVMICLGQIPDPIENKPVLRLDIAKHHVDMLCVIQDKTKGNLSADENEALDNLIHQLRMFYVELSK